MGLGDISTDRRAVWSTVCANAIFEGEAQVVLFPTTSPSCNSP